MTASLFSLSLDCADAAGLASFWSELLERPVDAGATAGFAAIGLAEGGASGLVWMFHQVPEAAGGKQIKNRVHADLISPDRPGAVKKALGLGATSLGEFDESGFQWTTLTDPEGNEFDIVAAPA
jgi:Glyoxalase-like domain